MPDTLVFHESFDSTRATAGHPDDHPNLAQAQAEAVVSLLLGRSLSVNHTYAFDSRGMLDLADVVLETWEQAKQEARNATGKGAARLAQAQPLVLHRFRQPTFFAACSDQLRRSNPKDEKKFFQLSAWEPISKLPEVRHALAYALEQRAAGGTMPPLPAEIRDDPQLARYLDVLLRLNGYFEETGEYDRSREARTPQTPLQDYVTHLLALSPAQVAELAAGRDCPEQTALQLQTMVRKKTEKSGAAAVNRHWVHSGADLAEHDPLLGDQVQELVDTLYNAVMAESACAQFEYMSSVPRVDGRDELKHANALAMGLIHDTRLAKGELTAPEISLRMAGMFAAAEAVPSLTVAPLRTIFEAYWALVADDERWPTWQDSCTHLNRLIRRDTPVDQELRDAWQSHLAELQRSLAHVVAIERGRLAVSVPSGDVDCMQTLDIEELSQEDLDLSFAAGEYLDDLARSIATEKARKK